VNSYSYRVDVRLSKQEDGFWRAEAPALRGCFADAETVHEALAAIQEIAAMMIDLDLEDDGVVSEGAVTTTDDAFELITPVVPLEHRFRRLRVRRLSRAV
jgi:predicted RNase H-like HicB family nuclease